MLALLSLCLIGHVNAGNQAATWKIPNGEEVVSLTGKMNIPKRGSNFRRPNRGMVAYWPALRGHNFFMQTCLIDGPEPQGYGTQNAAYHGACAGKGDCFCRGSKGQQCNDHEHILKEGGTFSFYIEKRGALWVAGFTTTSGLSSEVWMKMEGKADNHVTAILLEDVYDSADETPTEPLEVWDIVAKNPQGKSFDMKWSCNQDGRKFSHINCNWKSGNRQGVQVTFGHAPPPSPPSPPSPPLPPSPPSPPSPTQCGSCKVCFNPSNGKCQADGAHRPKTKAACEAKGHIWCGPSTPLVSLAAAVAETIV